MPPYIDNGDEARYPDKIGSCSKGLPHNNFGEVDHTAYATLTKAEVATRALKAQCSLKRNPCKDHYSFVGT